MAARGNSQLLQDSGRVVDDKSAASLETYSMVKAGDKLYIADFAGGGVLMSSDNGETWELTDRESLFINVRDVGMMIDSFYNLEFFKGTCLYFRYAEACIATTLQPTDGRLSSINSISWRSPPCFDGCMVCGRSVPTSVRQGIIWYGLKTDTTGMA